MTGLRALQFIYITTSALCSNQFLDGLNCEDEFGAVEARELHVLRGKYFESISITYYYHLM